MRARRPPWTIGEPNDFVQSLRRGLAVIRAFDDDHPALTLSEVAKATGLARAAARRFLLTLVDLGYMRVDGRVFRLSPRLLDLGRPYLSSLTLPELALPHLRAFVADVQESATVAVLDGSEIVYVAHAPARSASSPSRSTVGTRDPASATSLGRALLAGQTDEWLDGYLTSTRAAPDHCQDDRRCLRRSGRELDRIGARATRSSTRSSRRGCARSPSRSTTATAASSQP